MAKRLTDTNKWNDDWFLSLDNDYRIIWQWLLDNCNHAGICKRSMKLLNMMCNTSITEDEMVEKMYDRVVIVGNNWFIPKFLKFQYSNLHSNKPVIVSVVKEIENNDLYDYIPQSFGNDYLIVKSKSKDKSKDIDKDKDNTNTLHNKLNNSEILKNKNGNEQFSKSEQANASGADFVFNRLLSYQNKTKRN